RDAPLFATGRSPRRRDSASAARVRELALQGYCPGSTSTQLRRDARPPADAASVTQTPRCPSRDRLGSSGRREDAGVGSTWVVTINDRPNRASAGKRLTLRQVADSDGP